MESGRSAAIARRLAAGGYEGRIAATHRIPAISTRPVDRSVGTIATAGLSATTLEAKMKIGPVDLIEVAHQAIDIDVAYDRFVQNFESILGKFDPGVAATFAKDPRLAEEAIKAMEGEQGLMIFAHQDHGSLFLLIGHQRRKARRYLLGNPRVAIQMTRHDIRAGLYAPLTILVYEVSEDVVRIEFDRPSSLLGQFKSASVSKVAKELDEKLEKVIERAAQLSSL